MYLIYFDERKYEKDKFKYYILGGVILNEENVIQVENQLNDLAFQFFSKKEIEKDTEFHAQQIVHNRKNHYESYSIDERVRLFKNILEIISKNNVEVMHVNINVEKAPFNIENLNHWALMMFVEKADALMAKRKDLAFLIGDHDRPYQNSSPENLNNYKVSKTNGRLGKNIKHIIDTLYFGHSHNSRLLQLADVYTYTKGICNKTRRSRFEDEILKHYKSLKIFETTYRNYPE